jgi:hypothetical protein
MAVAFHVYRVKRRKTRHRDGILTDSDVRLFGDYKTFHL